MKRTRTLSQDVIPDLKLLCKKTETEKLCRDKKRKEGEAWRCHNEGVRVKEVQVHVGYNSGLVTIVHIIHGKPHSNLRDLDILNDYLSQQNLSSLIPKKFRPSNSAEIFSNILFYFSLLVSMTFWSFRPDIEVFRVQKTSNNLKK